MAPREKSKGLLVDQIVTAWFLKIEKSEKLNEDLIEKIKKLYDNGQIIKTKKITEIIKEG